VSFSITFSIETRLALVAIALAGLACGSSQIGAIDEPSPSPDPEQAEASAEPEPMPAEWRPPAEFSLRDIDGRTARLSDHRGKVVLMNFWATWCVPCAAELPHLERIYQAYQDDGFVVLAISMDGPESSAEVVPYARRIGLSFPVLLDTETRVVGLYNPRRAAPYTLILGHDGRVAKTHEGYSTGDEVAVEAKVKELLEIRNSTP
jgi:peroxiredoxin